MNIFQDDMKEGFCCDADNPNACCHKDYNGSIRGATSDCRVVDDPSCNPDRPLKVTFEEITSAAYKIKSGIINTPCSVISKKQDTRTHS